MRILFVVPRFGDRIAGGAEAHARDLALRLRARGHEIEVVTSCALSYVDWTNVLPEGAHDDGGITVHRLRVGRRRSDALWPRVVGPGRRPAPYLQREWLRLLGPWLPELPAWLVERSADFDIAHVFVYFSWTAWAGLRHAACPVTLQVSAHDEPSLYLPLFDHMVRLADGFTFNSEEEAELVRRRFRVIRTSAVTGNGVELKRSGNADSFRSQYQLGDDPYIACIGRTDTGKGSLELVDFFATYKRRRPSSLKLLIIGEELERIERHPDIVLTGFVESQIVHDGLSGAELLVQPSFYESFSLVLAEAWVLARPALVQGRCAVLEGHALRSGGALPYRGYAEFEAGLDMLLDDAALRRELGAAGRRYVERFGWDAVLDRYERFFVEVAATAAVPAAV
jgi:glycosyltransferase involved in cell wall biosynthesis